MLRDKAASLFEQLMHVFPPAEKPKNRRRAHRVAVNSQFALLYGHIDRYVTNLSATGAFIRANELRELGAEVPLSLTITDGGIERIEGVGRVVRVNRTEPRGMGVEFVSLSAESKALIRRLVATVGDTAPAKPMLPIRFENPQVE